MRILLVWLFRLSWAALVLTTGPALDGALQDRSRPVQLVATIGVWVVWTVVLVASLVPTTVSLTVLRTYAPTSVAAAAVSWAAGASLAAGVLALAGAVVTTVLALSGELGEAFAQGSAYGHEQRFPLRAPAPYLLIVPLAWSLTTAALLVGPLALAARNWALGAPVTALAAALPVLIAKRFHRLSRRWIVLVPAGIVLHDYLVLAETCMVTKTEATSVGLALAETQAANLTGNAPGPALEIRLRESTTVVLAAPPRGQTRALHVFSMLVSPSRPGRALAELQRLGIPTGTR